MWALVLCMHNNHVCIQNEIATSTLLVHMIAVVSGYGLLISTWSNTPFHAVQQKRRTSCMLSQWLRGHWTTVPGSTFIPFLYVPSHYSVSPLSSLQLLLANLFCVIDKLNQQSLHIYPTPNFCICRYCTLIKFCILITFSILYAHTTLLLSPWSFFSSSQHDIKVVEMRTLEGYGARWQLLSDGTCSQFRGFLEPQMMEWT